MSRAKDFNVQQVIDYLQGTYMQLQEVVEIYYPDMSEDDLTEEDHFEIDNQIFLCETCGWWYELCEQCSETEDCNENDCQDCCESSH